MEVIQFERFNKIIISIILILTIIFLPTFIPLLYLNRYKQIYGGIADFSIGKNKT